MKTLKMNYHLLLFVTLGLLITNANGVAYPSTPMPYATLDLNRSSFPAGFIFGTASAAYQYEGAASEYGRGPSIWDYYTKTYPERIDDRSNGDVAIDQYHKYKEDVGIMKDMGLDAFRFSISWSRILPNGKLSGGINPLGVEYYNNLIDELLANGIVPYVTLFHWDLPQPLQEEYGGLLSSRIVSDYQDYADVCFKEFGDRVKHWITFNEPWGISNGGYAVGVFAPGRCSSWQNLNCTGGNSSTEPYLVNHHLLLSHAAAVKLYKEIYQTSQNGIIGITLVTHWFEPYSNSTEDHKAAHRALDFMLGWCMDPIINGDYPSSMRSLVGSRLPNFTQEESTQLKGSYDFFGINYYTTNYAQDMPEPASSNLSYVTDARANLTTERNGVPIGDPTASDWLYVYPKGIRRLLNYIKNKYGNPLVYITENGVDEVNNSTMTLAQQLYDPMRINYYYQHLRNLHKAIENGANVKGYFAWSLLDNFEWNQGYTVRFGLNYVDYKDGLKRFPKYSAFWFKSFLMKTD